MPILICWKVLVLMCHYKIICICSWKASLDILYINLKGDLCIKDRLDIIGFGCISLFCYENWGLPIGWMHTLTIADWSYLLWISKGKPNFHKIHARQLEWAWMEQTFLEASKNNSPINKYNIFLMHLNSYLFFCYMLTCAAAYQVETLTRDLTYQIPLWNTPFFSEEFAMLYLIHP